MDDTRKIFLKQLATKKKEFEDTLDRLMQSQKEYNEQYSEPADEFDHAQREILLFNNYSLVEKKAKELKSIDRLIRRVSRDQNFGICEECGNPIPAARLWIVPEATLCVECQRELEKWDHLKNLALKSSSGYRDLPQNKWVESEEPYECLETLEDGYLDCDLESLSLPEIEETGATEHLDGN